MRSNKIIFMSLALICSFFVVLSFANPANSINVPESSALRQQIIVKNDVLSMDVQNIGLDTILSRVADQTDIRILFYGLPTQKITMQLDSMPLEEALKRVLKNSSVSFLYSEKKNKSGKSQVVLNEIIIISEKKGAEIVYSKSADDDAGSLNSPPAPPTEREGAPAEEETASEDNVKDTERIYGDGVFVKLTPETSRNITVQEIFSSSNTITTALNSTISQKIKTPVDQIGVKIHTVEQGSALETLGLQPDDVIRQINGEAASDASKAESIIRETIVNKADTTIKIEVERDEIIEPIYIELN
ncbi:site-2 protease family protein [Desulfobacter curvatus]|uniref:site-2 protease family protein n=1 Tax=Desulfobacter curvatus TaxID=2290 RepID=UPI00035F322C|nr:site-2 protease family protein [Desulfobacter curvatus]